MISRIFQNFIKQRVLSIEMSLFKRKVFDFYEWVILALLRKKMGKIRWAHLYFGSDEFCVILQHRFSESPGDPHWLLPFGFSIDFYIFVKLIYFNLWFTLVLVARDIWAGFEGEVRLTPGDLRCSPRSAGKTAPGPFISTQ